MADFKLNSDELTNNRYHSYTSSVAAIAAEKVEMTIQSKQQNFQILKEINWAIKKGDIEILMGPSGSGKTTLLSILAGLLTPTSGKVYLLGQEITKMSRTQLPAL